MRRTSTTGLSNVVDLDVRQSFRFIRLKLGCSDMQTDKGMKVKVVEHSAKKYRANSKKGSPGWQQFVIEPYEDHNFCNLSGSTVQYCTYNTVNLRY
jgi:hypothetical protein